VPPAVDGRARSRRAAPSDREEWNGDVGQWTDCKRVGKGSDSDCSAQHPPQGEDGHFHRRANESDRPPWSGQTRHESVSRAGAHARTDVEACCDPIADDRACQCCDAQRESLGSGQQVKCQVDHEANYDAVAERA